MKITEHDGHSIPIGYFIVIYTVTISSPFFAKFCVLSASRALAF